MGRTWGRTPARCDGFLARLARLASSLSAVRQGARPIAGATVSAAALVVGMAVGTSALVASVALPALVARPPGQHLAVSPSPISPSSGSVDQAQLAAGARRRSTPRGGPSLTLVDQSWVVEPGEPFTLVVGVHHGSMDERLRVLVYSRLHTRSGLAAASRGELGGTLLYESPALDPRSLPSAGVGRLELELVLQTPTHPTPAVPAGSLGPVPLECPGGPGSCGGVYPVVVQLQGGRRAASLISALVYSYPRRTPGSVASPLRVALVVPLTAPLAALHLSTAAQSEVAGLARASASAHLPLTLAPEPALLDTVSTWTPTARRALETALHTPDRQVLAGPLVPVDLPALLHAGLAADARAQWTEGCAALHGLPLAARSALVPGPLDAPAAELVAGSCGGVHDLVLPATDLAGPPCPLSCSAPVDLTGTTSPDLRAVGIDQQSSEELEGFPGSPELDAHWFLADLTLTAYEEPSAAEPRGLVVLPDPKGLSPTTVTLALQGLAEDPAVEPVTLSTFFAQVPVGADGQPATRHLVTPALAPAALPFGQLRRDSAAATTLASALGSSPDGRQLVASVRTVLLLAESSVLDAAERRSALRGFQAALASLTDRIRLPAATIRLTSSQALRVPITVTNQTGAPVRGALRVQSDQLFFVPSAGCRGIDPVPGGDTGISCPVTLSRATNAVYLTVRARAPGAFQVRLTLLAANGHLLTTGRLEVQSFSATWEALLLTGAALAVLLAWWLRTLLRRPRGRHGRGRHAGGRPISDRSGDPATVLGTGA